MIGQLKLTPWRGVSSAFGLVLLAWLGGACSSSTPAEADVHIGPSSLTASGLNPGLAFGPFSPPPKLDGPAPLPQSFVDKKGRKWQFRRKITEWAPEQAEGNAHGDADAAPAPQLDTLTDAELAERWRPVMLIGDSEYIADADVASITAMRQKKSSRSSYVGDYNNGRPHLGLETLDASSLLGFGTFGTGTPPAYRPAAGAAIPDSLFNVIYGDYRLARGETYAGLHPYRAAVQIGPGPDTKGYLRNSCSGYMVHHHTALSAAHCFYYNTKLSGSNNGGTWLNTRTMAFGVVTRRTTGSTWATPSITGQSAWLAPTNCYGVTVHPTYREPMPGTINQLPIYPPDNTDIAVVDFDPAGVCGGQYPGYYTGWYPFAYTNDNADYNNGVWSYLYGYDGVTSTPPYVNTDPNVPFTPPTIVERYDYAAVKTAIASGSAWYRLNHALDTDGGASGSGVILPLFARWNNWNLFYVGNHTHGGIPYSSGKCPPGYGNTECNQGVRFEQEFALLVQYASQDF